MLFLQLRRYGHFPPRGRAHGQPSAPHAYGDRHPCSSLKFIPDEIQQALLLQELRPIPALAALRGQAGALELVAGFLGVFHGQELRNAREAAGVLAVLPCSDSDSDSDSDATWASLSV